MTYDLEDQVPLGLCTKPNNCHWCSGALIRLSNVYKGKNCQRYYCSEDCLKRGEERALVYLHATSNMPSMSGGNVWQVVVQNGVPSLARSPVALHHALGDDRLGETQA